MNINKSLKIQIVSNLNFNDRDSAAADHAGVSDFGF
jgi:hypothetical protein